MKSKKKRADLFFSVFPSVSPSVSPVISVVKSHFWTPASAGVTNIKKTMCWIATSFSLFAMISGTAFAAITIPFTINLSEVVTVTGTPRIAVDVGGN